MPGPRTLPSFGSVKSTMMPEPRAPRVVEPLGAGAADGALGADLLAEVFPLLGCPGQEERIGLRPRFVDGDLAGDQGIDPFGGAGGLEEVARFFVAAHVHDVAAVLALDLAAHDHVRVACGGALGRLDVGDRRLTLAVNALTGEANGGERRVEEGDLDDLAEAGALAGVEGHRDCHGGLDGGVGGRDGHGGVDGVFGAGR